MKKKLISKGKLINLSLSFTRFLHEYHENRIKKENGESNVNSDSADGSVGNFFSKLASKIRKIIQGEN